MQENIGWGIHNMMSTRGLQLENVLIFSDATTLLIGTNRLRIFWVGGCVPWFPKVKAKGRCPQKEAKGWRLK